MIRNSNYDPRIWNVWSIGLITIFVTFFCTSISSNAKTLFVDSKSSCPGNGSSTNPYCSLNLAISLATPGDTLMLRSGNYPENITITKQVTILTEDGLAVIGTNVDISKEIISIHNINLGHGEFDKIPPVEFAERIRVTGDQIVEDVKAGKTSWDILGLNECFAKKTRKIGGIWCDKYYKEKTVPCLVTNTQSYTASCLSSFLTAGFGNNVNNYSFQEGEVGTVANGKLFDVIEEKAWRIGKRPLLCELRRQVVGTRLRINSTGHILPFFSTHISSDASKREDQIRHLIAAIKELWQPGDLTPIVVGDFNYWITQDKWMGAEFDEVGLLFGHDRTEHIWIGKESSFPGASGAMEIMDYQEFGISTPEHHFDHPITYSELATPVEYFTTFNRANLKIDSLINSPTGVKNYFITDGSKRLFTMDNMQPGEILYPGQSISSANGKYNFTFQADGNLVLYKTSNGKALWSSRTDNKPSAACIMQKDGNLVIYNTNANPIWASNTDGNVGSRLSVQDDGNVVIYRSDETQVWATNTVQSNFTRGSISEGKENIQLLLEILIHNNASQFYPFPGSLEFQSAYIFLRPDGQGISRLINESMEDCLLFDPNALDVRKNQRWWTLYKGDISLLSFNSEGAAWRALHLLKQFGFNQICYIGRGPGNNTVLKYFKKSD